MTKGIGITTRNRQQCLETSLNHFAAFHTDEDLYVVIDDNSDNWLLNARLVAQFARGVDARVVYRRSTERLGIAGAKNECLIELHSMDDIFLFDDDAFPRCPEWSSNWAAAAKTWGIEHSMFNVSADWDNGDEAFYRVTQTLGDGPEGMSDWSNCCGVALHFTQKCINKIGGYDVAAARNVYGYEHAQMSRRAALAGLTKGMKYPSPTMIHEWVYSIDMSWFWKHWDPPFDIPWVADFRSSVTPEEASRTEDNAPMMRTTRARVPLPRAHRSVEHRFSVDAIIPCKSNFAGLELLVGQLVDDPAVLDIVVVADGDAARSHIAAMNLPVDLRSVELSVGLHKMWNHGLNRLDGSGRHVAIINDDVSLTPGAMSTVAAMLDANPELGLISPSQDPAHTTPLDVTTGFAGYCMVLARDLAPQWRFDEQMMWWYGDNDVIMWVSKTMGRLTGLTGACHALGNRSHTITTDPPPNFHADIQNDAKLYHAKWG